LEKKYWVNHVNDFDIIDARKLKGNFLLAILKKAKSIPVSGGLTIIQNFEPIPLYGSMRNLGFEHHTEKTINGVYYAHFYRREILEAGEEIPLKPIVMPLYAEIDNTIADLAVNFWANIWDKTEPAIELKTKLLLSLSNAVGSGRMRQATRELVKAYYLGVTVEQFDEVFALFMWNQGIGYFSSEIAPSPLFRAYLLVKNLESRGKEKKEIVAELKEKFGEKSPETGFQ
jgi:hypothetical protein